MFKNYLVIILVSLFLMGCQTTEPLVVKETKNVYIPVPDELIKNCDVEAPPNKETYVSSNTQKKEELMFTHARNQMSNIKKCNNTINSIRNWNTKQLELYKDKKG